MKTLQISIAMILGMVLLTSCTTDVVIQEDVYIEEVPSISLESVLQEYELWYVAIERTEGSGEVPFLQKAFTVSFEQGQVYANTNLVGIGTKGNGVGLPIGYYDTFGTEVDITHDLDGVYTLEVTAIAPDTLRLYDRVTNTSYYLEGYQRVAFDYDRLFYDHIHYFLHEYEVWEKVYTSQLGAVNEFDQENYLSFLYHGAGDNFRSSKDPVGLPVRELVYDYRGHYAVNDVDNVLDLKTLTLDYDYLGNEHFELTVINDRKISLFHPASGTVYEFVGRNYLQFKNDTTQKNRSQEKKRMKKIDFMKLTTTVE